jgi:uncharacterized protein YndB with AHSA1/START domain
VPRVSRRRTIAAPREEVWALVSDPYSLPRWWPRTKRVENVEDGVERSEWTVVLETAEGRGVRADYRSLDAPEGERCGWEQRLAGTPFARHLRRSSVEIELRPDGERTEVRLSSDQAMRGLSRLGSPMLRGAQGRILDEALDGIGRALGGAE